MARYLVTGSAGFIGLHLCSFLTSQGHSVISCDPADGSGCVLNMEALRKKAATADGAFHLGAIASVQESIRHPERAFDVNVTGARNVFEASHRAGNIPVVYASSSAVYGDNPVLPLRETERLQPLSPYAQHKCENEADAARYGQKHRLPSFGLRLFNVYGPGQNPASPYSGVISIFHQKIASGQPITIFGDGQQTRDFLHITDAVTALMMAMICTSKEAPIANVCTGTQTSLLNLVDLLGQVAQREPEIAFAPARTGDIVHSCGDPKKFEVLSGFSPQITIDQGLKRLS
jgi:UDP-glucose 4-epimerase